MDFTFLGGFIKYVLPWLFGIVCAFVVTLDVISVFFRRKSVPVGILNAVCHMLLVLGLFLLGAEIHLMVLAFFSSLLLILVLEYVKCQISRKKDREGDEV